LGIPCWLSTLLVLELITLTLATAGFPINITYMAREKFYTDYVSKLDLEINENSLWLILTSAFDYEKTLRINLEEDDVLKLASDLINAKQIIDKNKK
jgi:hypothetical protein